MEGNSVARALSQVLLIHTFLCVPSPRVPNLTLCCQSTFGARAEFRDSVLLKSEKPFYWLE
jgi:hypothetical protein